MKNTLIRVLSLMLLGILVAACAPAATPTPELPENDLPYAGDLLGAVINPPRPVDDYVLASTDGTDFSFAEHRGQILLLYFGYRACPDFCPTTFAELSRLYAALNNPVDQVKVLFLTVDPERDTLDMLTAYTHAFNPAFIGLRAERDTLETIMRAFGVVAQRQDIEGSAAGYLIDHTASIFLIGPDGRLQSQYLYGTDYRDIVHDIQLILEAQPA